MSSKIKNILFFFGDQHRADCIGSCGNPVVKTPVMDRMAETGVRFANAFTPAPTCTPARACLQSGQRPNRHGIIFNPEFQNLNGGLLEFKEDTPFFARSLREKGYNLAHIGKWHVGHHSGNSTSKPVDIGYDEGVYYRGYGWPSGPVVSDHYMNYLKGLGLDGFNIPDPVRAREGKSVYGGIQEGPKEASVPYYLAKQTIEKLDGYCDSDKPFFTECHFWGPHSPYYLPEEVYNRYEDVDVDVWPNFGCDMALKPDAVNTWGKRWGVHAMDDAMLKDMIKRYYAYITHIDECMGMVIDHLKDKGKLDETLIVYAADHGAFVGSHNAWDKGYGMYDCLVRVPMIMSHASFKPSVNDSNVDLLDLAPTFMDAAGVKADERMDGTSLLPICNGEKDAVHGDAQIIAHAGHTVPFAERMVRTSKYKYICNSTDKDEVYDLENDPHEMNNIADTVDKTILADLKGCLLTWMRETKDTMGLRFMAAKLS